MRKASIISVTNVTESTFQNTIVIGLVYKGVVVAAVTQRILTNFILDTRSHLQSSAHANELQ